MVTTYKQLLCDVNLIVDGGQDRGKKASKLLDYSTAFSSIEYSGIEECEAYGNLCSCQ
jgi:hypothetical protein